MRTELFRRRMNVMIVFMICMWPLLVPGRVVRRRYIVSTARMMLIRRPLIFITAIQIAILLLLDPDVMQFVPLVFGSLSIHIALLILVVS